MTDYDLTAYCGLYCGDCIRYRSGASDLAKDLLAQFKKQQFAEYAEVKRTQMPGFEHFQSTIAVLEAISQLKCRLPCRLGGDGCGGTCLIVKCVKNKSLQGCWECAEYETCRNFDFLIPFHGNTPVYNLGKIREYGIDAWAAHRGKCYPWGA